MTDLLKSALNVSNYERFATDSEAYRLLNDTQGNILLFHKRRFAAHQFFHIDEPVTARRRLSEHVDALTTTWQQLRSPADGRIPS